MLVTHDGKRKKEGTRKKERTRNMDKHAARSQDFGSGDPRGKRLSLATKMGPAVAAPG